MLAPRVQSETLKFVAHLPKIMLTKNFLRNSWILSTCHGSKLPSKWLYGTAEKSPDLADQWTVNQRCVSPPFYWKVFFGWVHPKRNVFFSFFLLTLGTRLFWKLNLFLRSQLFDNLPWWPNIYFCTSNQVFGLYNFQSRLICEISMTFTTLRYLI